MPELSHFKNFEIKEKEVLLRLGYTPSKAKLTENFSTILKEEIEFAKKIIIPQKIINISNIKIIDEENILLDNELKITSKKIVLLLKYCVKIFSFLVTIGKHLEEKRNYYSSKKETTRALILDAIGSVTAEELAEIVNKEIIKECEKENLKTTNRFSPGYGDWNLKQQKEFLNFLQAEKIGVKLSESFIMQPEKSVSAILGAYPQDIKNTQWKETFEL